MEKLVYQEANILVYDPTRAIDSFYQKPLAQENIHLHCYDRLADFLQASQHHSPQLILAYLDYFHQIHSQNKAPHPLMEQRGQKSVSLDQIICSLQQAQQNSACPSLLLEYHLNFPEDDSLLTPEEEHQQRPARLPYTREELCARFSGEVSFLKRAYTLDKLKESLSALLPRQKPAQRTLAEPLPPKAVYA